MFGKSNDRDLGLRAVREIYRRAMIDEEWSIWEDRGFSWWGYRLRQRVWAEPGVMSRGFRVYRVSIQTDCLRDMEITDAVIGGVGLIARDAAVAAPVLDPESGKLFAFTSLYVHEEIFEWAVLKILYPFAVIQLIEAERMAAAGPEVFKTGTPDYSAHPTSGPRPEPDELLGVIDNLIRPLGRLAPRWPGCEEFPRILDMLNRSNCVATDGGELLTAEFSFGGDTSLLQVDGGAKHRDLGNGALITLKLPLRWELSAAARLAAEWNRLESRAGTSIHFLGSWAVAEVGDGFSPMFVSFSPAAVYNPGLAANLVLTVAARAKWAEDWFGLPGSDVKETVRKRLREFPLREMLSDLKRD